MNGRKAKELRALAQMITVGKPAVEYGRVMKGTSPTATIAMRECTRRTYKNLKRASKSGAGIVKPQATVGGVQQAV